MMKFIFELPDFINLQYFQKHQREDTINYKNKKKIRGIYALFDNEGLVYIGMSTDLWQRLQGHKVCQIEGSFSSYVFQEFKKVSIAQLLVYEAIYIAYYKPPWNRHAHSKYLYK